MTTNETKIFVRDLKIDALIGFLPQEIGHKQPIIVNIEATLTDHRILTDNIESTVSYAPIVEEIRKTADRQFSLLEKLADHLADFVLEDKRIQNVRVKVEKLRIFSDCSVGTEIFRTRT